MGSAGADVEAMLTMQNIDIARSPPPAARRG
jgi:hypothetical protein